MTHFHFKHACQARQLALSSTPFMNSPVKLKLCVYGCQYVAKGPPTQFSLKAVAKKDVKRKSVLGN